MIVLLPHSLLANQMYQYAVAKSLCIDRKENLKIVIPKRLHKEKDKDNNLGSNLWTAFYQIIAEDEIIESHNFDEYLQDVNVVVDENDLPYSYFLTIDSNAFIRGRLLWHPDDFAHNIDKIRQCFALPEELKVSVERKIYDIKRKFENRPIVAVHFRVGWDYYREGRCLKYSFWDNAALQVIQDYKNPIFALLYDEKNNYIQKFMNKYESIIVRDTLFKDLLFMSMSDGLIVGNSTFGTWGGILNNSPQFNGYRPSIYPIDMGKCSTNAWYPSEWKIIDAQSNYNSRIFGFFYQMLYQLPARKFRQFIKKIIRYRNY